MSGVLGKNKKNYSSPRYVILISIFYFIILVLGDSVLLGELELENEVLGISSVVFGFVGCRSDG